MGDVRDDGHLPQQQGECGMIDSIDKLEWFLNNRGKELSMKQIAVVGGLGTGKKTLVNTLMGGNIDLPTSIMPFHYDVKLQQKKDEYGVKARLTDGTDVEISDMRSEEIHILEERERTGIRKLIMSCDMPYPNLTIDIVELYREDSRELFDTINYSDAIIVVINATRALFSLEQEFILRYFCGRKLKNVFFVFTRKNGLPEEEMESFRQYITEKLRDVFTDENDRFDQLLYDSRVFLVDAYTSLCARTGRPIKVRKGGKWVDFPVFKEDDQYTGVPELERELYRFLGYIN